MDDTLAGIICKVVADRVERGPPLDYWSRDDFLGLVRHAGEIPGVEDAALDEVHSAVAMGWLMGSRIRSSAPHERGALLSRLRELWPDDLDRRLKSIVEVSIDFGCRVGGETGDTDRGWVRPWPGAIAAVGLAVKDSVDEVNKWLERLPYPLGRDATQDAMIIADALIAPFASVVARQVRITRSADGGRFELQTSEWHSTFVPNGAKLVFSLEETAHLHVDDEVLIVPAGSRIVVFSAEDKVEIRGLPRGKKMLQDQQFAEFRGRLLLTNRKCSCGTTRCEERHRLARWDPAKTTLRSFLASAVKGPDRSMKTNTLKVGMYLPLLAFEGLPRVRTVPVEFSVCGSCDTKYEGERCVVCDKSFDSSAMRRIAREWLIPVGVDPELYDREQRLRCPEFGEHYAALRGSKPQQRLGAEWENLYKPDSIPPDEVKELLRAYRAYMKRKRDGQPSAPAGFWDCPLCGRVPPPRVSHIWARTWARAVDLGDVGGGLE